MNDANQPSPPLGDSNDPTELTLDWGMPSNPLANEDPVADALHPSSHKNSGRWGIGNFESQVLSFEFG